MSNHEHVAWETMLVYLERLQKSEGDKSPNDRIGDGSIRTIQIIHDWCDVQNLLAYSRYVKENTKGAGA